MNDFEQLKKSHKKRQQEREVLHQTIEDNNLMNQRITVSQAAELKTTSKQTIHTNIDKFTVEDGPWMGQGYMKMIVCDSKFKAWEPNRQYQEAAKNAYKKEEA